jgi:hypothetical protein
LVVVAGDAGATTIKGMLGSRANRAGSFSERLRHVKAAEAILQNQEHK